MIKVYSTCYLSCGYFFAAEKYWLLSICCHISIVVHYFSIIINFEWFWELSVYWYCKKLMKKNRRFCKASKIKLATNWCKHWLQTDAPKNLVATNWRSDTACKKNLYQIIGGYKKHIKVFIFICVFQLYGNLPYTYTLSFFPFPPPSLPYPLSLPSLLPELPPMRMWPQPFSPTLYRICTRAQENCGKPVPIQSAIKQSLSPV